MDENNYYYAILQNNTFSRLIVGQKIVVLKQIDSTNNFIKKELSKSAPLTEGTVIMAEEQFAGRGQRENKWISPPGLNLTFSVLLNPTFLAPENQFSLNYAMSLAVNDALRPIIGDTLKIKWPNDIYVKDEKLGGILIENIIRGSEWKHAIVGIGLNVNQISFDPTLRNVTSLKKILHQDYELQVLLKQICSALNYRYSLLQSGNHDLRNEYINNLYWLGQIRRYSIDGVERLGEIKGVDDNGLLQLKLGDSVSSFGFKEVSYIIP